MDTHVERKKNNAKRERKIERVVMQEQEKERVRQRKKFWPNQELVVGRNSCRGARGSFPDNGTNWPQVFLLPRFSHRRPPTNKHFHSHIWFCCQGLVWNIKDVSW